MCSGGEERGVGAASLGKEKEGVRLEGEDEEQEKRTSKGKVFPNQVDIVGNKARAANARNAVRDRRRRERRARDV